MLKLRKMTLDDIAQIVEIEKTHTPDPWTEGIFSDCLLIGYTCYVFSDEDEIANYAVLSNTQEEAHVLNIATKKTYRRQGLARKMMLHLIKLCKEKKIENKHRYDLYSFSTRYKRKNYKGNYNYNK